MPEQRNDPAHPTADKQRRLITLTESARLTGLFTMLFGGVSAGQPVPCACHFNLCRDGHVRERLESRVGRIPLAPPLVNGATIKGAIAARSNGSCQGVSGRRRRENVVGWAPVSHVDNLCQAVGATRGARPRGHLLVEGAARLMSWQSFRAKGPDLGLRRLCRGWPAGGHLNKTKTVPCQPKKAAVAKA